MKNKATKLKESKKRYMGGFRGRKGKGEVIKLCYSLKIKTFYKAQSSKITSKTQDNLLTVNTRQ